jgi:hypothetical protein
MGRPSSSQKARYLSMMIRTIRSQEQILLKGQKGGPKSKGYIPSSLPWDAVIPQNLYRVVYCPKRRKT